MPYPGTRLISGLTLAIDLRHNRKDAWYTVGGNYTGTLNGGAVMASGGVDVDASGESLTIPVGSTAVVPGVQGVMMVEVDFDAGVGATHEVAMSASPLSGSANNRLAVYRRSNGVLTFNCSTSTAGDNLAGSDDIDSAGIKTFTCYWSGWDGTTGTADWGVSLNGATPIEVTGQTKTRTEVASTGVVMLGNFSTGTTLPLMGLVKRAAMFNITNPAGIDCTAAHDTDAIWNSIFPPITPKVYYS